LIWKNSFDERQVSLSENMFNLGNYIKYGLSWYTAEEYAVLGLNEAMKAASPGPYTRAAMATWGNVNLRHLCYASHSRHRSKKGRCVRLKQGRMEDETRYSPTRWPWPKVAGLGAGRLHVVDLDGAVGGKPANSEIIEAICRALSIPVQLGGGVRDIKAVGRTLELGVSRVILGTLAARSRKRPCEAAKAHPGQVVIGIDARGGKVAVEGWTETSAAGLPGAGPGISTRPGGGHRVHRHRPRRHADRTQPGVHRPSCAAHVQVPVIASGGVHDMATSNGC
jgi:phosphoribosylformimino-5-aminoimidazole carboxamide ribotide isomerase